jgi:hypothetical protein
MPIIKWIVHYIVSLPVIVIILAGVQYVKGRSLDYSIEFGIILGVISVTIFAIRRYYNFKKNIRCSVCNDLPKEK